MRLHAVTTVLFVGIAAAPALGQDAAAGARVFNQCRACHTIEDGGPNRVGPNLHGVVGRKAASKEGFRYSANMKELGEQMQFVDGQRMVFGGFTPILDEKA